MLRNNNRGAGLVTVVAVLAVCGILLAGVMGFAYQQHKSVLYFSENNAELAEVELCAQLLLHRSAEDTGADVVLEAFYGTQLSDQEGESLSLLFDGGKVLLVSEDTVSGIEKWTISYIIDEETVISRVYYYQWENGKWQFADPPETPEETEDVSS